MWFTLLFMAFKHLEQFQDGVLLKQLAGVYLPSHFEDTYNFRPFQPPRRLIYHYTDITGLRGIIQSNCLRASAARYLNDSSEVDYGCSLVVEILNRWVDKNKGNKQRPSPSMRVLKTLHYVFTEPESTIARSADIYVACFCENENLLSQWRAYGQKGGYSIGFEIEDSWPTASIRVPDPSWESRLEKVTYESRFQLARIDQLLAVCFELIRDHAPDDSVLKNLDADALVFEIAEFVSELLLDEIATFKNPAFSEENEWRLVVRPRWIDRKANTSMVSLLKFRESRGCLVPYLDLRPPDERRLPIRSIRYGPSLIRERVEDPLKLLLAASGFGEVRITGSQLPVLL